MYYRWQGLLPFSIIPGLALFFMAIATSWMVNQLTKVGTVFFKICLSVIFIILSALYFNSVCIEGNILYINLFTLSALGFIKALIPLIQSNHLTIYIGKHSLEIYFFHLFALKFVERFHLAALSEWLVIIELLIVVTLSLLFCFITEKSKHISRFVFYK